MPSPTDTEPVADFSPSASFRATMEAVTSGERDAGKLRDTAAEQATERLGRDPVPVEDDKPSDDDKPGDDTPGDDDKPVDDDKPTDETPSDDDKPGDDTPGDDDKPDDDKPDDKGKKTREDLRKELESKGEPPKPTDEENLRGEQPSDSTRMRKRVKHYENLLATHEKTIEETKSQLEELQTKVKTYEEKGGALPDDIKEQLTELRQYRRREAIEKDPEFQERFSGKLEESNELVDDSLKSIGISEKLRTQIKEMGGIGAFIRSDVKIPIRAEGGKTEKVDARKFVALALDTMKNSAPDAESVLRAELASQRRLEAEKAKFIEKAASEADAFFEEQEKTRQTIDYQSEEVEKRLDEVVTQFSQSVHNRDWMKDLEIPADATADKTKEIKAINSRRAQLRQFFDLQLKMPVVREAAKRATKQEDLDEFANMLIDATRVFHVEHELKSAQKKIKDLESELDKVRRAGSRSTPRRTTGGRVPADTSGEPKPSDFQSDLQFSIAHNRWKEAQGK